jgi:hypothetical protein
MARLAALDAARREVNALKRQNSPRMSVFWHTSRRHGQIAYAAGGRLCLAGGLGIDFPTGQMGRLQWPDRV